MSLKIENLLNEVQMAGGIISAKPVDFSGSSSVKLPGSTIVGANGLVANKSITTSTAANAAITATALVGGLFVHTETGAGGTATLPLGTTLSAAVSGVATGSAFEVWYVNNGTAGTGTITGATGTTVVGTAAVPTGKTASLRFYCSGTNTWNIYTLVSV